MFCPEFITLESSAYVISWMLPGGAGIETIYRLNSVGLSTPPWGTPCIIIARIIIHCGGLSAAKATKNQPILYKKSGTLASYEIFVSDMHHVCHKIPLPL